MMIDADKILAIMRKTGQFGGVERLRYDMTAEDLLNAVETVGKARNTRFVIDESLRFAYLNIAKWIVGDKTMACHNPATKEVVQGDLRKGIYLAGRTGCGKTYAFELFGYVARLCRFEFRSDFKTVPLSLEDVRADDITEEFMKEGDLTLYETKLPCLVINDLGSEPTESIYMGNRVDVVRQVLEKRGDFDNLITCITSNLPMGSNALSSRYGDRVASRLKKMCNYLEINGPDRRG